MSKNEDYKMYLSGLMPPSLRLYSMRFKDYGLVKDDRFYEILSNSFGYASLRLRIAERNLGRSIEKIFFKRKNHDRKTII